MTRAVASPNLALAKYWGKADTARNLPATPSLGVTLDAFHSRVEVELSGAETEDQVEVDGRPADQRRFHAFFSAVRDQCRTSSRFHVSARNDFPTAAGLASSASGFAALAAASATACGQPLAESELSALARIGSASAARSIFGGWVHLPAGAECAEQLEPADAWPEFRVIVAIVSGGAKRTGSRDAMERTRDTSLSYASWVDGSHALYREAIAALRERDLSRLGHAAQLSAYRMFATMLAANPPIRYWAPATIDVLDAVERIREDGVEAWETMDAGPQVKVLCLEQDVAAIVAALRDGCPGCRTVVSGIGAGVQVAAID